MSQMPIEVQVFQFVRQRASDPYEAIEQKEYKTIVEDQHTYELPMVVLEQDDKGNTLRYMACNVKPSAAPVVQAKEQAVAKKKRSVVAKSPKNVVTPVVEEPVVEAPVTPDPPAPVAKRRKRDARDDPFVQAFLAAALD
jgi:hypothetical protein